MPDMRAIVSFDREIEWFALSRGASAEINASFFRARFLVVLQVKENGKEKRCMRVGAVGIVG